MFNKDIGIDLGTANVLIHIKGQGIVLNEPSVVAIDADSKKVLAVGNEAYKMLGRTPGKIMAIRPMRDGVIADFEVTEIMLKHFLTKIKARGILNKPRILVCCPSNITQVEKNAIKEAVYLSGARKVFIEEEPKVAAVGAGMDISKPSGNMIIDMGGGTTDIAILSLGDIVNSTSIKVAGDTFDTDILKYVKDKHKLLIGDITAEEIKKNIGTVFKGNREETMEVNGRNLVSGLPISIELTSDQIADALKESASVIVQGAKNVLEQTTPELAADISKKGMILTGGGALINGLDKLLENELKVPVYLAETPLTCVVEGTGILLNNIHLVDR
ncbi:MAG: rod shape-determining protein MreB [Bacilli bacterium]